MKNGFKDIKNFTLYSLLMVIDVLLLVLKLINELKLIFDFKIAY
ncbi:hypothetical protein JJD26997_1518 [Campylobacter jejuni subsp. doylei 269.97]|uniref:Uncharacterized protein n=1 Tax=Campylobacter jejuni subsp. doylei (strain ATCC BAA-1458 / RM4099 / 269.97) TaxID=360109 RepID=A7H4V1_CAMJD|nr:hypothetical protein JJD26997_1518 [Campylobacter jejuni subsp. doylei 269.97]